VSEQQTAWVGLSKIVCSVFVLDMGFCCRLAESERAEPTALRITVGPVTDDNTLPARASSYASRGGDSLIFFRAPPITSADRSQNPRSTAQAGSSSSTSMGGAGRLDPGRARGPASTLPEGSPQGGGQAIANSQNSNRGGSQQMLPDDVVMTLLRREIRLAYACNHAWTVNDVEEDKKLSEVRRLLEQVS